MHDSHQTKTYFIRRNRSCKSSIFACTKLKCRTTLRIHDCKYYFSNQQNIYIYIMQANTKSQPQVYINAGADITLPQNYREQEISKSCGLSTILPWQLIFITVLHSRISDQIKQLHLFQQTSVTVMACSFSWCMQIGYSQHVVGACFLQLTSLVLGFLGQK